MADSIPRTNAGETGHRILHYTETAKSSAFDGQTETKAAIGLG